MKKMGNDPEKKKFYTESLQWGASADPNVIRHYTDEGLIEEHVSEERMKEYVAELEAKYEALAIERERLYWQNWEYATNSKEEDRVLLGKFPVFCGPGNYLPDYYTWNRDRLVRDRNMPEEAREKEKQGYYRDPAYGDYCKGNR